MADVKVESDDVRKATSAAQTAADEAKQNTAHAQSADSATNATNANKANSADNAVKWNGAAKTVSSAAASGGADGDLWFQYV